MLETLTSNTLLSVLLFAFLAAFIVDAISNLVEFDHKISNALASAVVFMVLAGGLTYYFEGDMIETALYAGMLFVADFIGNLVIPNNRFFNAVATGVLFALFLLAYLMFFTVSL